MRLVVQHPKDLRGLLGTMLGLMESTALVAIRATSSGATLSMGNSEFEEIHATTHDAVVDEPGEAVVSASALVAALTGGHRGSLIRLDGRRVIIEHGVVGAMPPGSVSLPVQDPGIAIPPPFEAPTDGVLEVPAFAAMARRALTCVVDEDTRFSINGALLEATGADITLSSTDGHRLTRVKTERASLGPTLTAVLPRFLLRAVAELGPGYHMDGNPRAWLSRDGRVHVATDTGLRAAAKPIRAVFPSVGKVVPRDSPTRILVDRHSLALAVGAIAGLVNEYTPIVKLTAEAVSVVIETCAHAQGQARFVVPAEVTAPPRGRRSQLEVPARCHRGAADGWAGDRDPPCGR